MVAGQLQVIDTCAQVKTSVPLAASSVQACSPGGTKANLAPPVSATSDRIFYRDGDTKIRYLTPDGHSADVTTVPGSATSVSFFSVSPDDQHIAVLVEDVSPATTIGLRLYVEDLQGGGHHADIYSTTIEKSGNTLWPMAWYGGLHRCFWWSFTRRVACRRASDRKPQGDDHRNMPGHQARDSQPVAISGRGGMRGLSIRAHFLQLERRRHRQRFAE
jgi:hypothetical protein